MQCNGVGGMHGVGSRIGSGARVPSCMKQRGPSKLLRKSGSLSRLDKNKTINGI